MDSAKNLRHLRIIVMIIRQKVFEDVMMTIESEDAGFQEKGSLKLRVVSTPLVLNTVLNQETEEKRQEPVSNLEKKNEDFSESESDSDDEEFFSKSFSLNVKREETSAIDSAFARGLRALCEVEEEPGGMGETETSELSDSEKFQRDLELERRESLDSSILQNDADFLFEAGEKYDSKDSELTFKTSSLPLESRCWSGPRVSPESILEAMLFVGDRDNKPLFLKNACEFIRNVSEIEAVEILADLNERYYRNGAPYKIVPDQGGYRLVLLSKYDRLLERFSGKTKEFRLSQTAIDVLALVAYRQPITLADILDARPNASSVITQLVRRDLISLEKHAADKKKVPVYRTSARFLKLFNLASLDELPVIGDIDYR